MKKQPKNLEEIKLFCEQHNLTLAQLIYGELIDSSLDLESVTIIPDNTTFNVGSSLYLRSVTSIPYRTITGACSQGTKNFVTSVLSEKKADYTIQEIIELTKGQYGSESFKQFFIK